MAVPSGMGMLFGALGIKPDEIMASVKQVTSAIEHTDARMTRIEAKLDLVMQHMGLSVPAPNAPAIEDKSNVE